MAIQFVGQLQTTVFGDGTTTSVSIDISGQLVANLQASPVPIDRHNLPVGVESVAGPVPGTGTLTGSILSLSFSSPMPTGDNQLVVKLFFAAP